MDPLSALSLSCNVLELVTAAGKTCAFLYNVHKEGTFPNHDELVSTTDLLDKSTQALNQRLQDPQNPTRSLKPEDKELFEISQKARKLASDLQKKLEALQVQATDSRSKRLEKLFKTVLQKGKIYDLQRRWKELHKAVKSALLVRSILESEKNAIQTNDKFDSLEQQVTQGLARLDDIDSEMKRQHDRISHVTSTEAQSTRLKVAAEAEAGRQHTSQEAETSRTVSKFEAEKTRQHVTEESNLNRQELRSISQSAVENIGRHIDIAHHETRSHVGEQFELRQREKLDEKRRSRFINSFRFPELNERRNQITEAHSGTYEWSLKEDSKTQWDSFSGWLQSSLSTMFWIHGKAGSGKSTLMHFICEHEKTQELLDQWAAPHKTIILSWYFWNSGSQAQRSLKGALCALLYQIFSAQADIFLDLLRTEPYLGRQEVPADWSQSELLNIFPKVFPSLRGHVAIFLDGLDEFDRGEDIAILLKLLRCLNDESNVKICLSSRPEQWMVLELGHLPQLRLQDLTAADITRYINDSLQPALRNWSSHAFDKLVKEISRKADGVFLWVRLVTKSLLQGSSNSDNYEILMERLELLPEKLENLYEHMWRSLNGDGDLPTYRRQTALFFSFLDRFPMPLLDFAIATDEDIYKMAQSTTQNVIVLEALSKRCEEMKALLQTRCAGLLEIEPDQSSDVSDEESEPDQGNDSESDSPLSFDSSPKVAGVDPIRQMSSTLKRLGTVQFFHRTARDFLLEKPAGQKIMDGYRVSDQGLVERLLRAYLGRRLCGIDHPQDFETPEVWGEDEHQNLNTAIKLIGSLSEQDAEFQYKLLQHVESIYLCSLIPRWDGFVDKSCRQNWFLSIPYGTSRFLPNFWSEVNAVIGSSDLTEFILRDHCAEDPEFATCLLAEMCNYFETGNGLFTRERLSVIQTLLNAGADPNSTRAFTPNTSTPWLWFLIAAINYTRGIPGAGTSRIVTGIQSFLSHGADLSSWTVVKIYLAQRDDPILVDHMDKLLEVTPMAVVSVLNGAFLLQQLRSKIHDVAEQGHIDKFLKGTSVVPSRRHLTVMWDTGWYRIYLDDPDPFNMWNEFVRCSVDFEVQVFAFGKHSVTFNVQASIFGKHYPEFFSRDRKVRLRVLMKEQGFITEQKLELERGKGSAGSLAWCYKHWRTRSLLSDLTAFTDEAYWQIKAILRSMLSVLPCHLSLFLDDFGSLTESTVPREDVTVILRSFWLWFCKEYYDAVLIRCLRDAGDDLRNYTAEDLDADFQELREILRIHGLEDLAFQGKHLALDGEGRRIPWCAEEPDESALTGDIWLNWDP